MKFTRTAKILVASGATLLVGALFFGKKARANQQLNTYTLPASDDSGFSKIITNHDQVYDYKFENGQWFTRKKGSSTWINMKTALTPEKYQLAVSRLKKYL